MFCVFIINDNIVDFVYFIVDIASLFEEAVCDVRMVRRRKLNVFFEECRVTSLSRKFMFLWEEVSERLRERYVERISDIIVVVLNIVFEENVVCLWNVL